MPWIESHQTLREHPKTYALMDALGIQKAQAIGHLHLLWWWCLDYAPDGRFARNDNKKIARAAGYMGEASKFTQAMIDSGFMEIVPDPGQGGGDGVGGRGEGGGVVQVHDWGEYALSYHASQERNERKREQTRTRVAEFRRKKSGGNAAVTKSNAATVPTIPTNHTKPERDSVSAKVAEVSPKPYEVKTDIQEIVVAYKTSQGVAFDDRTWDAGNFARASKTAATLLRELAGKDAAIKAIQGVKDWAESNGLSWTIETVLKRAADWRAGRLAPKAATSSGPRVPRIPDAREALKGIEDQGKDLRALEPSL